VSVSDPPNSPAALRTGSRRIRRKARRAGGFTLIELAFAIVVIALLLGSLIVPLQTQVENRKIEETRRILEQAREALLAYASAYGYFPCPASATSNGVEAGANHATGACSLTTLGTNVFIGFLPAVTLGLSPTDAQGYLLDGWGLSPQNRVRYAIFRDGASTSLFVRVGGMRSAGMAAIAGMSLLHVCASSIGVNGSTNCGTAQTLTSNAPVVIWSVGSNQHPSPGINPPNADEAQNPNPNGGSNDRIFVSRARSGAGAPGGSFDDIVVWIAPTILFSRLIAAGQLP
jgi:type II secretory pathway pseudopilin PulG